MTMMTLALARTEDSFPLDHDGRLLPKFHSFQQRAAAASKVAAIVRESASVSDRVELEGRRGATKFGDRRKLRGIPVFGVGSGTSPGTDPLAEAIKSEERRERNRRPADER